MVKKKITVPGFNIKIVFPGREIPIIKVSWPQWLCATLKYLQCMSNGGTAVLHYAIDFMSFMTPYEGEKASLYWNVLLIQYKMLCQCKNPWCGDVGMDFPQYGNSCVDNIISYSFQNQPISL